MIRFTLFPCIGVILLFLSGCSVSDVDAALALVAKLNELFFKSIGLIIFIMFAIWAINDRK